MNFSQFIAVLRARWKQAAIIFVGTVALAILATFVLPKKYKGEASVVVDFKPDPINGIATTMLNPTIIATQIDIIGSDRVARKVIHALKLDQSPAVREQWQDETDGEGTVEDWLVTLLQKHLDVLPSRESNVITVVYTAPDPKFAATLANAFVQAFLDTSLELRVDPAKQYSTFFDQRATAARDKLAGAQAKLSAYQRDNGIVGSDERLDVESQRLDELTSQLVVTQGLATESRSRSSMVATNGDHMSEALNNPVVAGLKIDQSRAEANLQELNTRLGPNNPQVIQARANIAELRSRLDAEVRRVAAGVNINAAVDSGRVAEIRAQVEAQRAKILKIKETRDGMSVLQRDVDNAQQAYDAINTRLTQTTLESQTQQSNVVLLSQATPPVKPSSPKILLDLAAGIFFGMLFAIASVLFSEMLDRRVRRPQDLAIILGLPVLGVVPRPAISRGPTLMAQRVISGRLAAPTKSKRGST